MFFGNKMVSIYFLFIKYNFSYYSFKMFKEECIDIYYVFEFYLGIECWWVIDSYCDSLVLNKGINIISGVDNVLWEKLVVGIRIVLIKGLSGYVFFRNIWLFVMCELYKYVRMSIKFEENKYFDFLIFLNFVKM